MTIMLNRSCCIPLMVHEFIVDKTFPFGYRWEASSCAAEDESCARA